MSTDEIDRATNYIHEHPSVIEVEGEGSLTRTYRWETEDGRSIFLYVNFFLKHNKDKEPYLFVTTNLESSEVKGQGNALWDFLQKTLLRISQEGIRDTGALPILHEVSPNQYSLRLVEQDGGYQKRGNSYYKLIE